MRPEGGGPTATPRGRGEPVQLNRSAVSRREPDSSPRRPTGTHIVNVPARTRPLLAAALVVGVSLPAVPALAGTGGAAYGEGEPGVTASPAPQGPLTVRGSRLVKRKLRVAGVLSGVPAGTQVAVQRLDPRRGWLTEATVPTAADGSFVASFAPRSSGRGQLRAVPAGVGPGAQAATAPPAQPLTVFRPATATFFGPGLYGRTTACGQRMTRTLQGVAHRRLPCGTQVELLFRGHTITVPVVDRGPFKDGVSWDLTWATAQALGMQETATIGAVSIRP